MSAPLSTAVFKAGRLPAGQTSSGILGTLSAPYRKVGVIFCMNEKSTFGSVEAILRILSTKYTDSSQMNLLNAVKILPTVKGRLKHIPSLSGLTRQSSPSSDRNNRYFRRPQTGLSGQAR